MKFIKKGKACKDLSTHHKAKGSYPFNQSLKDKVLQDLLEEQGFLCGFCMRKISEKNATIEHLISQSFNNDSGGYEYKKIFSTYKENLEELIGRIKRIDSSNIGKTHDTNYKNMIAVCEGNNNEFCINDMTCDKRRAKHQDKRPLLFITPLNQIKMNNIKFSAHGIIYYKSFLNTDEIEDLTKSKKITQEEKNKGFTQYDVNYHLSEDENIQYDLNHVLNLNCDGLVEERARILQSIRKTLSYGANSKNYKKIANERAKRLLVEWEDKTNNQFKEFCEVAIFRLKKEL